MFTQGENIGVGIRYFDGLGCYYLITIDCEFTLGNVSGELLKEVGI